MFTIEYESHGELQGEFSSFDAAVAELRRRAAIPWSEAPNRAPCESWATCGRRYEIVEYDTRNTPWLQVRRTTMLEISADGITWHGAG